MQKFAFIVSFLLTTSYVFSQTTEEEYNYVTRGYQNQQQSGLDMKKGYQLSDISYQVSNIQMIFGDTLQKTEIARIWLKALYKVDANSKKVAAYMIVYKLNDGIESYMCVPHPKSSDEIKKRYFESLQDSGNPKYSIFKLKMVAYILSTNLKW